MNKSKFIIIMIAVVLFTGCSNDIAGNINDVESTDAIQDEYETLELSCTLYADSTYEYSLPIESTISEMIVREGQFVNEGDLLYTVDYTEYLTNETKFESEFYEALEYSDGKYKLVTLTATGEGFVMELNAEEGLSLYEEGGTPLCKIVRDRMSVSIEDDDFNPRQRVTVVVCGEDNTGTIKQIEDGVAVVEISKCYYGEGTEARVYTSDKSKLLGTGDLYYSSEVPMYYYEGYVSNVYVRAGDYVERGDKICAVYIPSDDVWDVYMDILATVSGEIDLNSINVGDSIEDIQNQYGSIGHIVSSDTSYTEPYIIQCPVGEIYSINVEDGDEVEKGEKILTVKSPSRTIQQNYANIEDYYTQIRQLTNYNSYGAVAAQQSGIVKDISYSKGETVKTDNTVVTISKAEEYYVQVEADIFYMDILTSGKEVLITFTNNIIMQGYINAINYNADDDTLSVKISVPETNEITNGDIVPGMTGIVNITY